jgi:D-3-phosphoglycerate dehydrogenase/(S)-sulfolactate dehydrogenase
VLFEDAPLKIVQITGAGVDRLDRATLTKLGIPVANVAGGSNSAVAEYAVTAASALLRRLLGPTSRSERQLLQVPPRMVADNLSGSKVC